MNVILISLMFYIGVGFLALGVLEILTKRITRRLRPASVEAMGKLAQSGSFVGSKTALALTVGAMVLFWPFVIYSAVKRRGKEGDD